MMSTSAPIVTFYNVKLFGLSVTSRF